MTKQKWMGKTPPERAASRREGHTYRIHAAGTGVLLACDGHFGGKPFEDLRAAVAIVIDLEDTRPFTIIWEG